MEMTRFEKWLVNRNKKAERNIAMVRQHLAGLPSAAIKDVLELGCGIGSVASFLAEKYHMNVLGSDYDHEQIQIARKRHPENEHLTYQVEDAARLSFRNASFDLIISQNVFHHLPRWQAAVQEINRVLKPEGFLLWLDLIFPEWVSRLFQPLVKRSSLYCIAEVKYVFEKQGFKQLFDERLIHGLFFQHHIVWQKVR
jgi:ubiquinone/menaquinone biosynthesis C-methylase UbiE